MRRESVSSDTLWEDAVGYSRAVRVGLLVYVSGTTATSEDGSIVGTGDSYAQAKQALRNVEMVLRGLEARLSDVVRTGIYVTNIDQWEEVGRGPYPHVCQHISSTAPGPLELRRLLGFADRAGEDGEALL